MPKIATALNFSPIPVGLSGMQQFIHLSELLECSDEPCRAAGVYTLLWNFACSSNPRKDGAFRPMASCSLARICGWDGDADLLRGALLESGVISVRGDNWSLSGWEIYAEVAIKNRKKATEKKRGQRAKSPKQADRHNKSDSMSPGTSPGQDAGHPEGPFARKDKVQAKDKDKDNGGGVFHTGAKPSAAERQVALDSAPQGDVSQASAPPQAASPPAPTSEPRPGPERPAQANLAPRTQPAAAPGPEPSCGTALTRHPAAVAGPPPGSLSLADAYDAQRREWLTRRVASVPDGVPLSAGQLTLALCQDLQLGIDINIGGRHRTVIGELAGSATATHLQLAWIQTVAAASAKRDQPGLGLMLKILARVARQEVMPQTHDDWALDGAADNVSFTLEFRRKVAAMRAEEEAEAARKAAGGR